jgi:short-subunit dehydrogenase
MTVIIFAAQSVNLDPPPTQLTMKTSLKNRTILVTGASSGLGRETAQLLASRGARVFGTARNPQSAKSIPGVEMIALDVTSDDSVAAAVQAVLQKAGPITLLVNNAGYALVGAAEETSLTEAKQQFETNFFGVLRVTNAVLPSMRAAGYGRIANISSVVGFLPAPFMSMYAASKHALEGYTESLDHEVRSFGIRASLIEPAYTKSNISQSGQQAEQRLDAYAKNRQTLAQRVHHGIVNGEEPGPVAEAVLAALTAKTPRMRYPVGKGITLSRLRRFLPVGMFDGAIRKDAQLSA